MARQRTGWLTAVAFAAATAAPPPPERALLLFLGEFSPSPEETVDPTLLPASTAAASTPANAARSAQPLPVDIEPEEPRDER